MVRCPSTKEYDQWLAALQSQTVDNSRANYIQPLVDAPKSSYKVRNVHDFPLSYFDQLDICILPAYIIT